MAAKKIPKTSGDKVQVITESSTQFPAKKAAKVAKKAAKKIPATRATQSADLTTPAKKVSSKPTLDSVARAAYLNYRRRVEQGLPGDSHGDWLEAERQFRELD